VEENVRPAQVKNAVEKFDFCHSELVIGMVCAVGTDYEPIRLSLQKILAKYGYASRIIKISELIARLSESPLSDSPETQRIDSRMNAGNDLCRKTKRKDVWALASIAEINSHRSYDSSGSNAEPRTAHILLSLKRPQEVSTLRKVYGDGFFLVGIFATEKERLDYLIERNAPKDEAIRLIRRDAEETNDPYGQYTTETFHLSDVFVQSKDGKCEQELERFFDLVFSNPYITPTQQEHGMFLAYAASLRSAQLGRQVGAALTSKGGDVLAVGTNDVPKPGGGLYWPGPLDNRDHVLKIDSNDVQRGRMAQRLIDVVKDVEASRNDAVSKAVKTALGKSPSVAEELLETISGILKSPDFAADSLIKPFESRLDITEYGRAVHAEMDAILSCARSGVSPQGSLLYVTTFPCHNCTRHIIASGIERIYYIEPYGKSRAEELHEDEIVVEEKLERKRGRRRRVPFSHFVGVGPRRYFDLFSLSLSTGHELIRKKHGKTIEISRANAWTRIPLSPYSYLQKEEIAVEQFDLIYNKQLDMFNDQE
jgi:deoxycytidylate deaminase